MTSHRNDSSDEDDAVILADPRSRKARVKHSEALTALCERYRTTLDKSNVRVCEGRKVVYVLNVGEINETTCFLRENPTPSLRAKASMDGTIAPVKSRLWSSIMIPNGWKVAVVVDGDPWTAQVRVSNGNMDFRFTYVNNEGQETQEASDWCETPGAAFKSLFSKVHPNKDVGRHNGKLYIGCHYDNVQRILRDYFQKKKEKGEYDNRPEIKRLVEQWIADEPLDVPHRKPPKRAAVPKKSEDLLPVAASVPQRKRQKKSEGMPAPTFPVESNVQLPNTDASFMDDNDFAWLKDFSFSTSDFFDEICTKELQMLLNEEYTRLDSKHVEDNIAWQKETRVEHFQNKKDLLEGALMFALTSCSEDQFRPIEIFVFVCLKVDESKRVELNPNLTLEAVTRIMSLVRPMDSNQKLSDDEEDNEMDVNEKNMCSMEEFLAVLTYVEIETLLKLQHWLLDQSTSKVMDLRREELEEIENALKASPVFSTFSKETLDGMHERASKFVEERFDTWQHQLDELYPYLHDRAPEDSVCFGARKGYAQFMWHISRLPLSQKLTGTDPHGQGEQVFAPGIYDAWKQLSKSSWRRIVSDTRPR